MKKMLKYQLTDLSKALAVYLGVITLMLILGVTISGTVSASDININFNGIGFSNMILTFVLGICIYKEHFLMAVQNGIPRKVFFKSSLCTLAVLCLVCSAFDTLTIVFSDLLASKFSFEIMNIIQLIYADFFAEKGAFIGAAINLIFTFVLTFAGAGAGLLIAACFCRLPKKFRTIYVISLPLLCCFLLPISFTFFPRFWEKAAAAFLILMGLGPDTVNPLFGSLTLTVVLVILAGCCYRLLRKTEI